MKQFGAKRSRASRWASVPLRLVLVTVAAASALVTQFVMHNTGSLPEINLQNLIKPKPVAIGGVRCPALFKLGSMRICGAVMRRGPFLCSRDWR